MLLMPKLLAERHVGGLRISSPGFSTMASFDVQAGVNAMCGATAFIATVNPTAAAATTIASLDRLVCRA